MVEKMTNKPTCCIIGAGNVATQLAPALGRHLSIKAVFSRTYSNAETLAERISHDVVAFDDLQQIPLSDLYIISVNDDAIAEVIEKTKTMTDGIWTHTSGSCPASVFAGFKKNYGVFYPLQTFSKNKEVDLSEIPFLIEGNNRPTTDFLVSLAEKISRTVLEVDSRRRTAVHIAAVFACNFVNYLWSEASDILNKSGMNISVLKPLLRETLAKLDELTPLEAQTGPARRNDRDIIDKHLGMLEGRPNEIYRLLTDCIIEKYQTKRQLQEPF